MALTEKQYESEFICDECKNTFGVSDGGFIGSLDDFQFIMTKGNIKSEIEHIECSPFEHYIQLCKPCYTTKK